MACATLKRSMDWEPTLGAGPAKRRRCIPFCGTTSPSNSADTNHASSSSSVFPQITRRFTPETMAANIRAELRRFRRLEHLQFGTNSDDSGSESPSRSEKPVFTFNQVGMICERMLREKESEIREEYDNLLTTKLAEQYDAFVNFTYDQIQKNYSSVPSYLS